MYYANHKVHTVARGDLSPIARTDRDRTTGRVELGMRVDRALWDENLTPKGRLTRPVIVAGRKIHR